MKHIRTLDDAEQKPHLRFYTVESLGERQSLTPEGFLLCEEVAIARTGTLLYGPNEVPVTAGPDGVIKIQRNEEDVFAPTHIASYAGKAVANDHPDDDINPLNWNDLAVGVVMNPRRGTGLQSDLLVADLMITNADAIELVRAGKREVSCGYEADYEELSPGLGRQYNLFGNHVALVEAGRCGQRCAIRDHKPSTTGVEDMKTRDAKFKDKLPLLIKRFLDGIRNKDEAAVEEAVKELEKSTGDEGAAMDIPEGAEGDTHVHVHAGGEGRAVHDDESIQAHIDQNAQEHQEMRDSIEELRTQIAGMTGGGAGKAAGTGDDDDPLLEGEMSADDAEEIAEETGKAKDAVMKVRDSAFMEDSFQETVSMAEILVPGVRIPTFDKAANPKATLDMACKFRRTVLDMAYATQVGRDIIDQVNGKPLNLGGMKCAAVRSLFRAAAVAKKAVNAAGTHDVNGRKAPVAVKTGPMTLADINKMNAARYNTGA